MDSVQSFIRDEVKHGAFPSPIGAEAFSAYVIASSKGLIPEMENAARQTLELPMTFEFGFLVLIDVMLDTHIPSHLESRRLG